MRRRRYLQALGLGSGLSLGGCLGNPNQMSAPDGRLTLAAATTAYDSGLLDTLHPQFEATFGATVETVARGTGGALRTARNGDCDVVLTHARPLEDAFLKAGYGLNRRAVMVNDFILVGPPDDPADVIGRDPIPAFRMIADAQARFLSRGDRSGTHLRERRLWDDAGITPTGEWYLETGQGMGDTLHTAAQTGAYTLTDRGTFLAVGVDGTLERHVASDIDDPPPRLRNEYAVIPSNPARHDVAYQLAFAYVGFLTGPGRDLIEDFRVAGDRAFRPLGASSAPDFAQYVPTNWDV